MLIAPLCKKEVWYLSKRVLAAEAGRGSRSWIEAAWDSAAKESSENQAEGCQGGEAGQLAAC